MICSRLLYEWIALVFMCHVVGPILCVRVTTLGLERMLSFFGQYHAKGGADLDFPQSSVAVTCCDRAVSCYVSAVSQFNRAVSQCDRAVSQHDKAVSQFDRAVSQCDRAVSQFDRAVSQCDRAVSQHDRTVSQFDTAVSQFDRAVSFGRYGRGFRGSFYVNLCILTL